MPYFFWILAVLSLGVPPAKAEVTLFKLRCDVTVTGLSRSKTFTKTVAIEEPQQMIFSTDDLSFSLGHYFIMVRIRNSSESIRIPSSPYLEVVGYEKNDKKPGGLGGGSRISLRTPTWVKSDSLRGELAGHTFVNSRVQGIDYTRLDFKCFITK